jgi:ATP synthase protein I
MSEDEKPPSLSDFDARLRKARAAQEGEGADDGGEGPTSQLGLGLRVAIEMVAAVAVSVGLGWLLDDWLGTTPWIMVALLPLGFVAGILNAYRVATRAGAPGPGTKAGGDGDSPET